MMGHSAAVLYALATMASTFSTEVASLSHSQLTAGQKFEVQTADRVYRGELVDRSTGECQMQSSPDGANFTPPRTVYLLGATAGRQARQMLVLMHEVKVGQKMELGIGDLEAKNRRVTGEVQRIRLSE